MNHVLLLTKNNLSLTKKCVDSIWNQDVLTRIHVYDNESTDGTQEWLDSQMGIVNHSSGVDLGVSGAWNFTLDDIFNGWNASAVLVANNDTVLAPWTLRRLAKYNVPFVSGIAVDREVKEEPPFDSNDLNPHPDFSLFYLRRSAWKVVGPFDKRMRLYASDCAWHVEAHRKGIQLWKSNTPYYHVNSQTLKRADPADRELIQSQANKDREVFQSIYGCLPGTEEYNQLFK